MVSDRGLDRNSVRPGALVGSFGRFGAFGAVAAACVGRGGGGGRRAAAPPVSATGPGARAPPRRRSWV